MERGKGQENERKERLSLIESHEKLCKWPLSVFPTQVTAERSPLHLKKELELNRLEVYFSLMNKQSAFYWSPRLDFKSEGRKKGTKEWENEEDEKRLQKK